jgi:hypothetical protein
LLGRGSTETGRQHLSIFYKLRKKLRVRLPGRLNVVLKDASGQTGRQYYNILYAFQKMPYHDGIDG